MPGNWARSIGSTHVLGLTVQNLIMCWAMSLWLNPMNMKLLINIPFLRRTMPMPCRVPCIVERKLESNRDDLKLTRCQLSSYLDPDQLGHMSTCSFRQLLAHGSQPACHCGDKEQRFIPMDPIFVFRIFRWESFIFHNQVEAHVILFVWLQGFQKMYSLTTRWNTFQLDISTPV